MLPHPQTHQLLLLLSNISLSLDSNPSPLNTHTLTPSLSHLNDLTNALNIEAHNHNNQSIPEANNNILQQIQRYLRKFFKDDPSIETNIQQHQLSDPLGKGSVADRLQQGERAREFSKEGLERFKSRLHGIIQERERELSSNLSVGERSPPMSVDRERYLQALEQIYRIYEQKKVSNIFLVNLIRCMERRGVGGERVGYYLINHIVGNGRYLRRVENKRKRLVIIQINRSLFQSYKSRVMRVFDDPVIIHP